VRLQLGLNLDVEVELKARLQGDVSLTLGFAADGFVLAVLVSRWLDI
jgi:adenine/guanine phosphoribosyltransferase-like PRPP-binding protein